MNRTWGGGGYLCGPGFAHMKTFEFRSYFGVWIEKWDCTSSKRRSALSKGAWIFRKLERSVEYERTCDRAKQGKTLLRQV